VRIRKRYFVLLLPLLLSVPARAEKVTIDDDTFFTIGALIQPQLTVTEEAAPNGDVGTDFFLRRARLLLTGQFDPNIGFIFITDQANFGRNGDFTPDVIVQDALGWYKFGPELTVSAGFMLLPFTRHGIQSAGALNLIDYRIPNFKFLATGAAFRDMGVEVRGLLVQDRIWYRAGIFSGIAGSTTDEGDEINPSDVPRATGMLRFNLLGKDDAYAPPGITFGTTPLVSFGVGIDWQNDAFGDGSDARYLAMAGDVFIDYPLSADQEVTAQATVIRYDGYLAASGPDEALSFFVEGGYRYLWFQPVVALEYFNGDAPGSEITNIRVGLNFWIAKSAYNVKAEVLIPNNEEVDGVTAPENLVGTVQAQVQF
jgi:Phosphate-selective porin O and P